MQRIDMKTAVHQTLERYAFNPPSETRVYECVTAARRVQISVHRMGLRHLLSKDAPVVTGEIVVTTGGRFSKVISDAPPPVPVPEYLPEYDFEDDF